MDATLRVSRIASGEVVAVKGGHIVTTAQLEALPELLQNSDIQIADDLHLVALFDDGSMRCQCGTDACRHFIEGRDWMLPELQERCRGGFSAHLQRWIDAAR